MIDDFLDSALREEARLVRRLAAVRAVIADYRGESIVAGDGARDEHNAPTTPPKPRVPRQESVASQVIKVSEEFLTKVGRRAQSAEIYGEMRRLGMEIHATNPAAIVSSYLSSSPKFDNIRGQGYGLATWNVHPDTDEAPASEPEGAS